ncbi:MAG: ABC transporter permease [Chloroflexia bacterium]|jgi:peptide/nickel transport system permease protein|nr:ABC transporter permease [Chloroflexia bacterium]
MTQYITRRLLILPVVLLGVSILVFLVIHLVPGNPAQVIAGADAPPETVAAIEEELGLNRPLPEQYLRYLGRVLQGDLGTSLRSNRPVIDEVMTALPRTIQLAVAAAVITPVIAIPLGVAAAAKRGTAIDTGLMMLSMLGITLPVFAVGLGLMWIFGYELGLLPISGAGGPIWTAEGLRSMILPAVTLAVGSVATMARLTRSTMLEILGQEFVRVARAKGLKEIPVLLKHALPNALLPIVTVLGLQFAYLLSGAVVTETIFAIPGVGRLAVYAIQGRDFPVVQGAVLVISLIFVLVNLMVDLLYAMIDPRIHYD